MNKKKTISKQVFFPVHVAKFLKVCNQLTLIVASLSGADIVVLIYIVPQVLRRAGWTPGRNSSAADFPELASILLAFSLLDLG